MLAIKENTNDIYDRSVFNELIYTPLSKALNLLEQRRKDPVLMKNIEDLLHGDIPEVLKHKKCGVFARQVATPNMDTQRFIKLSRENDLESVLFEYPEDKFISKNTFKHSLGQIRIHNGFDKKGNHLTEKINIIDMVKNDGSKLRDIKTLWGESLLSFHRDLFRYYKLPDDFVFYDISKWYNKNGGDAAGYYANYLMLFVAHGILFENFLVGGKEGEFSKTIVIPAIEKVISLTGMKPLIVPLSLMDMEDEEYWISHLPEVKTLISKYKS